MNLVSVSHMCDVCVCGAASKRNARSFSFLSQFLAGDPQLLTSPNRPELAGEVSSQNSAANQAFLI